MASPELVRADDLGLIPDSIRGRDMTESITRAEFAAVVVKVYESLSGTAAVPAATNPFTDTTDPGVLKAFAEDLAVGVSADRFGPDALLNREQAATMLTRVVKKISFDDWTYATDDQYELSFPEQPRFEDDAFSPRGVTTEEEAGGLASTTREQALALAVLGIRMRWGSGGPDQTATRDGTSARCWRSRSLGLSIDTCTRRPRASATLRSVRLVCPK